MTDTPKPNTDGNDDAAKAAAEKVEADKAAAAAAAAKLDKTDQRTIPENYDLVIPKESTLNEDHHKEVAAFAKANKLTNTEAQAILEKDSAFKASIIEGQQDELAESQAGWIEEAKKDSEIGGDKFDESVALAKRVIDKIGTPAFKKALNDSGLGDHPEVIRVFKRVGEHLKDDDFVLPGAAPKQNRTMEEVFYGDKNQKKE